jgi:hypothetical protein
VHVVHLVLGLAVVELRLDILASPDQHLALLVHTELLLLDRHLQTFLIRHAQQLTLTGREQVVVEEIRQRILEIRRLNRLLQVFLTKNRKGQSS